MKQASNSTLAAWGFTALAAFVVGAHDIYETRRDSTQIEKEAMAWRLEKYLQNNTAELTESARMSEGRAVVYNLPQPCLRIFYQWEAGGKYNSAELKVNDASIGNVPELVDIDRDGGKCDGKTAAEIGAKLQAANSELAWKAAQHILTSDNPAVQIVHHEEYSKGTNPVTGLPGTIVVDPVEMPGRTWTGQFEQLLRRYAM